MAALNKTNESYVYLSGRIGPMTCPSRDIWRSFLEYELDDQENERLLAHLQSCRGDCPKVVEAMIGEEKTLMEALLEIPGKEELPVGQEACPPPEALWDYAEDRLADEGPIEAHLGTCDRCLRRLMRIQQALLLPELDFDTAAVLDQLSPEKIFPNAIETTGEGLQKGKAATLMAKFSEVIQKSPAHLQETLERIGQSLNDLFQKTFAHPAPRFAPVFGEPRVTVLSPFGKVRYPIVFAWQPYEEADQYIISIEDTDWSRTTQETKVEIRPGELELAFGEEYLWELKAMKGGEVIEEGNGFFYLATMEEIKELEEVEGQLKEIGPEEDRLILWGGLLEEREFYMEAIEKYRQAYAIEPLPGIAYRIAYCYDKLELEELRDEWNYKIS